MNTSSLFVGEGWVGGNRMYHDLARDLRKNMTDAERRLWNHLRLRQIGQCRFRRQAPIGPYIADFVCFEKRLIIELDGGQHALHVDEDHQRTGWLSSQGFRVLRFWNNQVFKEWEGVLEAIGIALSSPSHPGGVESTRSGGLTPSPLVGEGWGGGSWPDDAANSTPHPNPPPQGGRGPEGPGNGRNKTRLQ